MNLDLRKNNGGAREGAGRPRTINGYRQIAVRLPAELAAWVLRQALKSCGGNEAELLRKLVKNAMEQDESDDKPTSEQRLPGGSSS
jgi:hypothetical protein